jgi:hypothetical protein
MNEETEIVIEETEIEQLADADLPQFALMIDLPS